MRHMLPTIAASLIPSLVFLSFLGTFNFSKANPTGISLILIFSIPISLMHMAAYVPAALIIERYYGLNLIKCVCLGFIVGCLYIGVTDWPYTNGSYIGKVEALFMGKEVIKAINGYPTIWGWLIYIKRALTAGLVFGAPAGLGYGLLYKKP